MQVSNVVHAPFICCPQRREPLVHNDTPDRPHALHTLVHSVVLTGSKPVSYRARHGASGKTGWAPARGRRAHGCAAWGLRIVKGSRRGSAATAFPAAPASPPDGVAPADFNRAARLTCVLATRPCVRIAVTSSARA